MDRLGDSANEKYGIHLDADFCRDKGLTAATRIILGQIRQYAMKPPYCIASNGKLADDCGVSCNTVTTAIATLSELGLIKVALGRGGRRTITAVVGATQELCDTEAVEIKNPGTPPPKNSGEAPKNCETPSQNLGGHLKRELKKNLREKKKTASSSSVLIQEPNPGAHLDPAEDRAVREWAAQAASLMGPRTWQHRQRDGTTAPVHLQVPTPAGASPKEIAQLKAFAGEFWPGCDPRMGMLQILLAAASTSDRRDRLQQYAHLATSGSLGARAVLRLGGRDDPLAFAREAAAGIDSPPSPVEPGTAAEAAQMRRYAYSDTASWGQPCWEPCWREAAGRCKRLCAPVALYMAAAACLYERGSGGYPLPWIACSLSFEKMQKFYPVYAADRKNAWIGGPGRPYADPQFCAHDYEPCVGRQIAQAAAAGRTRFTSKSCLMCAALELRIVPELAALVPEWKGAASELAALLDRLAAGTAQDIPPFRSTSCGIDDCSPGSFIRCAHGNVRGVGKWDEDPGAQPCETT